MPDPVSSGALQLWGGHECTVNRVGDRWLDQTVLSGHQDRLDDLARFAELGVTALRYPVLWERVSPNRPDERDWAWSDQRLGELRRLNVRPIAGLIHHGSGPRYTDLLNPEFARGLATHAAAVSERYPWVEDFTPVNEPLTTARFSALYGHWYPHARDQRSFWTAMLNQIDGVRLSVRAIRAVNPAARLIQTEDLGQSHATPSLADQAAYENLRRWATWDLLSGAVTPAHPLWADLARHGLGDRLRAIADDPCPPDVIGVNHYLTSERLLDPRPGRYPPHAYGGNDRRRYADVEAARGLAAGPVGLENLLRQTWDRYGLPIAVTEAHNGCSRDEQMRWFHEAWAAGERLRGDGVPIEAVTAWALLGSHDWNSLLTRADGHYESGVFDLRGEGGPRATAMVPMLEALARGRTPDSPALDGQGWWRRDIRFHYPPVGRTPSRARPKATAPARRLLLGDTSDGLGAAVRDACRHRDIAFRETSSGPRAMRGRRESFWAVVGARPGALVAWRDGGSERLVVSVADAFSSNDADDAAAIVARTLSAGRLVHATDLEVTPSFAPDAADAALDLLLDGETGDWRVAGETLPEIDFYRLIADRLGVDARLVRRVDAVDPRRTVFADRASVWTADGRTLPLPSLDSAVARFLARLPRRAPARRRAALPGCELKGDALASELIAAE